MILISNIILLTWTSDIIQFIRLRFRWTGHKGQKKFLGNLYVLSIWIWFRKCLLFIDTIWTFWPCCASQAKLVRVKHSGQWNFMGIKSMTIFIGSLAWTSTRDSSQKKPDPDWVSKVLLGIKKYDYFYCLFGLNFKQRQMQKRSMTLMRLKVDLVAKIVVYIHQCDRCCNMYMWWLKWTGG